MHTPTHTLKQNSAYICTHIYIYYIFIDKYVSKVFISASYNFSNLISYNHIIYLNSWEFSRILKYFIKHTFEVGATCFKHWFNVSRDGKFNKKIHLKLSSSGTESSVQMFISIHRAHRMHSDVIISKFSYGVQARTARSVGPVLCGTGTAWYPSASSVSNSLLQQPFCYSTFKENIKWSPYAYLNI